jgi:23S rRNA (uracil1939-C5)-methyltransferase
MGAGAASERTIAAEEVEIQSLSSEGDGVGRLSDGRVVFVEGGVPGDCVQLDRIRPERRFVRAEVGRLVRASPDRVTPACPHFGVCGGCQWQHLAYPAQLEAKRRIARDALERIGGITLPELPEIVPSPEPYGYRARARWVEAEGGLGYRARASRDARKVDACPVLVPAAAAVMRETAAQVAAQVAARGQGSRRRRVREWIVTAEGAAEGDRAVVSGPRPRGAPPSVRIDVDGIPLRVANTSFVQANALLWSPLAAAVCEACVGPDAIPATGVPMRFAELYCGVGFFTLPLAAMGAWGVAFESDRSALADLAHNLRRTGLEERVEVLRGRVEERGDLVRRLRDVDFVLVDPPRAGLAASVRRALVEAAPPRLVYLSCDPGTLARDLGELTAAGHRLTLLRLFDLFPQTAHVESLAVLERA